MEPEFEGNDIQKLDEGDLPDEDELDPTLSSDEEASDSDSVTGESINLAADTNRSKDADSATGSTHKNSESSKTCDKDIMSNDKTDVGNNMDDSNGKKKRKRKADTILETASGGFIVSDSTISTETSNKGKNDICLW